MKRLTFPLILLIGSTSLLGCTVELPDEGGEIAQAIGHSTLGANETNVLTAADIVVSSTEPPVVTVFVPMASPLLPMPSCPADNYPYKAVEFINGVGSAPQCLTADDVQNLKDSNHITLTADLVPNLGPGETTTTKGPIL